MSKLKIILAILSCIGYWILIAFISDTYRYKEFVIEIFTIALNLLPFFIISKVYKKITSESQTRRNANKLHGKWESADHENYDDKLYFYVDTSSTDRIFVKHNLMKKGNTHPYDEEINKITGKYPFFELFYDSNELFKVSFSSYDMISVKFANVEYTLFKRDGHI